MLSSTSEYALRSLSYLASRPKGTAVLGHDLAEECEIPPNYLSKILLSLKNAGFVTAARGTRGGYMLRCDPDRLRLIDVVELFEGERARPECLLGINSPCCDDKPCSAHAAWRGVRQAYIHLLENTTLTMISADKSDQSHHVGARLARRAHRGGNKR